MTFKLKLTLVALSALAISCAPMQAEQLFSPPVVDNKPPTTTTLPDQPVNPLCNFNPVEYSLDIDLMGLSMFDGQGNQGGFDVSAPTFSVGLNFNIEKAVTNFSMKATHLTDYRKTAITNPTTTSNVNFSIKAAYNGVGGGLSVKGKKSFATVIGNGIKDTLGKLHKELKAKNVAWETQIFGVSTPGQIYVIPISQDSGAKAGDLFDVYNFTPNWYGTAPCVVNKDTLYTRDDQRKVATVKLLDWGIGLARVQVVKTYSPEKIMNKAFVVQNPANRRELKRAIIINKVKSLGVIEVNGKEPLDLNEIMKTTAEGYVNQGGFYLREMN